MLRALRQIATRRPDPLSSVVLTLPVFLVYHLGVLLIDYRNGVDLVTELTFRLLEASIPGYIAVTLVLSAGLLVAIAVQRQRGRLRPAALGDIVLESCLWAALMLVSVGWAAAQFAALGADDRALATGSALQAMGPLDRLVMAAGAGFHEELVFRAGLLSGIAYMLRRYRGQSPRSAWAVATCGSALLFAVVHHLGPLGDPFTPDVFAFRTLAGLYLSGVYVLRGFAVAVYTHTFYDVLVFFIL